MLPSSFSTSMHVCTAVCYLFTAGFDSNTKNETHIEGYGFTLNLFIIYVETVMVLGLAIAADT